MKFIRSTETAEFKWKDVTFKFRAKATRGDQYEMHAAMAGSVGIEDGRLIKVKPGVLYPWVVERFVTDWNGVVDEHGKPVAWSIKNLLDLPAEPGEDLVLILGAHIFNHTGLIPSEADEARKKA